MTSPAGYSGTPLPKKLGTTLPPDGGFWVAWPKLASRMATDMTEDAVRDIALPMGWVDVKVCAIDATWSGLKLVLRKELRLVEHDSP